MTAVLACLTVMLAASVLTLTAAMLSSRISAAERARRTMQGASNEH